MFYIKATVTQLIDDSAYPEIILCEFIDVNGCKHKFVEKWPVISNEKFENIFPKDCLLGCVVVEKKAKSCVVDTNQPWCIESQEGKTVFEINTNLLLETTE